MVGELLSAEPAVVAVPASDPHHRTEQRERGHPRIDVANPPFPFEVAQRASDELDVAAVVVAKNSPTDRAVDLSAPPRLVNNPLARGP